MRVVATQPPLFGGQTESWWWDNLSKAQARTDARGQALFQFGMQRARAAGLDVTVTAGKVVVSPSAMAVRVLSPESGK